MEIKNLVIAPHVDDEILGCGGILNSSFLVYFCGIDESKIRDDKRGSKKGHESISKKLDSLWPV